MNPKSTNAGRRIAGQDSTHEMLDFCVAERVKELTKGSASATPR
jgi:hypothetical protein